MLGGEEHVPWGAGSLQLGAESVLGGIHFIVNIALKLSGLSQIIAIRQL